MRYDGLVWSAGKARKAGTCFLSGRPYDKGARVFRPLTNGARRMQRISAFAVDEAMVRHG
jgi:hypothetical protein